MHVYGSQVASLIRADRKFRGWLHVYISALSYIRVTTRGLTASLIGSSLISLCPTCLKFKLEHTILKHSMHAVQPN